MELISGIRLELLILCALRARYRVLGARLLHFGVFFWLLIIKIVTGIEYVLLFGFIAISNKRLLLQLNISLLKDMGSLGESI